ncbi:histone methyltransferase [Auriculariales sp. MPI-PUGE-AT-0066]|nr:histone methyltransferase [Auriculariales sp. MPI-PUGE-AT-0066]
MPDETTVEPGAIVAHHHASDGESEVDTPTPSPSRSPTPKAEVTAAPKKGKKKEDLPVQLIGHLPRAEADALRVFVELRQCEYQNGKIGRSRNVEEGFACECKYDPDVHDPDVACGPNSDCINRLTQIECLEDDCRCGPACLNQRFAQRQFADIHVVLTEKKGFGLRAAEDMPKDTFVYEYLGEVVDTGKFSKRMKQYADEGIRHFYFMMLQKDEFIDATKKGGLGRFANHSCNPNCYVAKWTVGKRVRMGIFTLRNVARDEELTFNYNVDRYGHDAQTCYCGEPNCVGAIGGKTQTDVAALDELYLDALGIADEVALLGLKGSRKKQGKRLGEDYMPEPRPLAYDDMPKIVQALRQATSRKIMERLLARVSLFEEWNEDDEMQMLFIGALDAITKGCITKAKVDSSKIADPVKLLDKWAELPDGYRIPKFKDRPIQVSVLHLPFTEPETTHEIIPKHDVPVPVPSILDPEPVLPRWLPFTRPHEDIHGGGDDERPAKRARWNQDTGNISHEEERNKILPAIRHRASAVVPGAAVGAAGMPKEVADMLKTQAAGPAVRMSLKEEQAAVLAIIARETAAAAAAAAAAVVDASTVETGPVVAAGAAESGVVVVREYLTDLELEERAARRKERLERRKVKEQRTRDKTERRERERRDRGDRATELRHLHFKKLVGEVVVKSIQKYQKHLTREQFKEHAKAVTEKVAASELKRIGSDTDKLKQLTDKQAEKIHGFIKPYMETAIHRIRKERKRAAAAPVASSSKQQQQQRADDGTPSTATDQTGPHTPPDDVDVAMDWDMQAADVLAEMNKDIPPEQEQEPEQESEDEDSDPDGMDVDSDDENPDNHTNRNIAREASASRKPLDADTDASPPPAPPATQSPSQQDPSLSVGPPPIAV